MDGLHNSNNLLVPLGDYLELVREEKVDYGYTHQLVMPNPTVYLKLSITSLYDMLDVAMEHTETQEIYNARSKLLKEKRKLEHYYKQPNNITKGDYLAKLDKLRVEVDIPNAFSVDLNTDFEELIAETIQLKILKSEDYYLQYNDELYNLTPIRTDGSCDGIVRMEFEINKKI